MTFLDQIRRRMPDRLQSWAVAFWASWLAIGVIVEIGAAFGWGRKHEGDTFSELWWTVVDKVRSGDRPSSVRGVIASVMALGAGGFFLWVSVHLATGYV